MRYHKSLLNSQENVSEVVANEENVSIVEGHWFRDAMLSYARAFTWGRVTVAFLLCVGLFSQVGVAAFDIHAGPGLWDGGQHGASSFGGGFSSGHGGEGNDGASTMVGGNTAPLVCEGANKLDILFLGNSYTHYFDMPQMLAKMAESAGCEINVEVVAPGGSRLARHAQSGASLSAIGSQDWDVVVLQNFSQLPSMPPREVQKKTFPHVQVLVDAIVDNDPSTSIYFYATWGRRDGDKQYCESNRLVCTFEGHSSALQRGYGMYATRFDASLANVGAAWLRVAKDPHAPFSYRELYDPDGSHPSIKGAYLSAAVFFATLYRASPEALAYPVGVSESSARYIQGVAAALPIQGV